MFAAESILGADMRHLGESEVLDNDVHARTDGMVFQTRPPDNRPWPGCILDEWIVRVP